MRVRVLGPVEVGPSDAPIVVATRKTRQVIALLALAAPNALSAERLADALWDEPPAAAMKTVQSHVSRARQALRAALHGREVISGSSSGYTMLLDERELDVLAAANLRQRARLAEAEGDATSAESLLREARALFRGEPELPSTMVGDAARSRVRDLDAALVEDHLRAMVDAGRAVDALVELEPAIAADPLREGLWAVRMLALYRSGRQADALRAYQDARATLADEVGVEPGPELRRLEAAILAHDPSLQPIPSPAALATFEFDMLRYAEVDGRHVAYATFGGEGRDLLVLMPGFITIDAYLEEPRLAAALRWLAQHRRVLALDRSGIGLSDPLLADQEPTLERWLADVLGVLDASRAAQVDVLANADTCLLALLLAAGHPERVASMTLLDPYARITQDDDYPFGMTMAIIDAIRAAALAPGAEDVDRLATVAPSMTDDHVFRAWWDRVGRRSASPRTAGRLLAVVAGADVRPALPDVVTRTLVFVRNACPSYDAGHGRYIAERLRDVEMVESDGADDLWWIGDDGLLDHLDRFTRGPGGSP